MTPLKMSTQARAELLETTPWAQNLSWEQVVRLAAYVQATQVRAERTVFREHARERYMCLILEGRVAILKEDSRLGQKKLAELGRGKAFGEIAVLDSQPRSASVVASVDTRMLVLSRKALEHMCEEQPKLANKLMWMLVEVVTARLRMTSGALVESL
tara:strand:- start:2194 stop:2664 length:471 start_codon:yes stop_codon:yes gene_type:complete